MYREWEGTIPREKKKERKGVNHDKEVDKLQDEKDWAAVDAEFDSYIKVGLVMGPELDDFSLEQHWQVHKSSAFHGHENLHYFDP